MSKPISTKIDMNVEVEIDSEEKVVAVNCEPVYLAVKRNGKNFYVKNFTEEYDEGNQVSCEVIEITDIISQASQITDANVRDALVSDGYEIVTINCCPTVDVE